MLINVQTLTPKFCCSDVQHWMALAIQVVLVHPAFDHYAQLRHLDQ